MQTSGDQYIIPSMKDQERRRRGYDTSDSHVLRASSAIQKTPKQFRRFLSWKNKKSLSVYLFTYWSTVCVSELQNISCVLLQMERTVICCHSVSSIDQMSVAAQQVEELHCNHEEADTCMLLHAKHASGSHDHVIIRRK